MIEADPLARLAGIRHAFFTRRGGVSAGIYDSLNCGYGSRDDAEAVRENRARAATAIGVPADALVSAHQVHSAEVVVVDAPWRRGEAPKVDAMVTTTPGIALGVLAADCTPVLLADPEARVIGAAHSGWPGTLKGVAEATVAAMCRLGAARGRIVAAIGPTIGPRSYEVGPEFPPRFAEADPESAAFFRPAAREGHFMFDLPGYVAHRLRRLGLAEVAPSIGDTYAHPDLYFSYRRACHRGEDDYGRGLSAIALD